MAMDNTSAVGGYRYTFIETPPQELMCLICHLVARDPQQLLCCGKLCCNSCLQESKKHTDNCPRCRKRALTQEAAAASLAIKRLKVQCKNSHDTAGQELGQHEANCDENAIIPCPNLCLIPSAPEVGEARYTTLTMPRKDLKNHLPECPRRKAICGYCGTSGVYQWVANRHMLECTKLEVVCPNDGCDERIIHLHLPEHRQMCMYESIPCRYETLGCTHATPRMDRDERQQHENNFEVHTQA